MKNKLQYELLEALIKFDFLFLQANYNKKNNRFYTKTYKPNSKQFFFTVLEPLELIKSIKQVMRLLQFMNAQMLNSKIIINFERDYHVELLQFLLSSSENIKEKISITGKNSSVISDINLKTFMFIGIKNSDRIYNRLYQKNSFLIIEINNLIQKHDPSFYKIFSDLNDLQKLVFFASLIKNIFTKENL